MALIQVRYFLTVKVVMVVMVMVMVVVTVMTVVAMLVMVMKEDHCCNKMIVNVE